MSDAPLYRYLAYAGALPFLACGLLPWAGIDSLGPLGSARDVLAVYGLAIASFLCGTHWTFELKDPGHWGPSLFVVSNVLVVAAWAALIVAPVSIALGVLALVFVALLAVDHRIHARGGTSGDYWQLRQRVTAVVLFALLAGVLA